MLTWTVYSIMSLLCMVLMLIGLTCARGIQSDGEPKVPLTLDVKDPVVYSQVPKEPQVTYINGAYAEIDLLYYNLYYPKYETFVGTQDHVTMLKMIHTNVNDVKVCLNYDVSAGNVTLGPFTCPLPFEPKQFDKCCGLEDAQFCCTDNKDGQGAGVAAFIVITVGILGFGCVAYIYVSNEA